jgi:hypothetical protein
MSRRSVLTRAQEARVRRIVREEVAAPRRRTDISRLDRDDLFKAMVLDKGPTFTPFSPRTVSEGGSPDE